MRKGAAGTRRVIAVLSPKGGTGKTTLATNLAVGLATRARNQTLLIDLDLQFGDAASALGLEPEYSLANAVAVPFLEPSSLKVFLDLHESSLALLPPPDDFVQAESIDHDRLKNVVDALINEFPYVVIDTAAGIDEASLLALEFASDLLFVTTPDVPSIRAVKRQLDALDRLGLMGHRRHFLLNRSDARVGLSKADIEATIGMPIVLEIPSSRVVPVSTNQGVPLLAGEGRDAVTKAMQSMVDHFLPDENSAEQIWSTLPPKGKLMGMENDSVKPPRSKQCHARATWPTTPHRGTRIRSGSSKGRPARRCLLDSVSVCSTRT